MSLLSKYLMRRILSSTLLVLLVLLSLSVLFEFIGQIDDVEGDFSIALALLYAVLRLPQLSFEMMPIAVNQMEMPLPYSPWQHHHKHRYRKRCY